MDEFKSTCDVCGKKETVVYSLKFEYQTDDIAQVCGSCERDITAHLFKLKKMTRKMDQSWIKQFMVAMRERLGGKVA